MLCSAFIHGPPDWLQPGQLNMPICTPSRPPSRTACPTASHHPSLNTGVSPGGRAPGSETWPMKAAPMPRSRISSRSLVTPALEMWLLSQ